jgi:hypothetical protein
LDIPDEPLEEVKLAFEQNGYSVHTTRQQPWHLVAIRVEPDRTPQPNAPVISIRHGSATKQR